MTKLKFFWRIVLAKYEFQFINIAKAIAIIFVIITHNNFSSSFRTNVFFMYFINMAVPIFMLITGFNYSLSFSRNCISTTVDRVKSCLKKFNRLTIPFFIILGIEWVFNIDGIRNHHFTTALINGGVGRGHYYYPVMVQIILLFSFIYILIKKYKEKAVCYIFLFQLLFEIICNLFKMNTHLYGVLCFRYVFLVALGSYLALKQDKISTNAMLLMGVIGLNYITILTCADSVNTYAQFELWSKTSLLTAFYIFPIFVYVYYNYNVNGSNYFSKLFSKIGKASWCIYLCQMVYFCVISNYLNYSLKIMIPISLFVNIIAGLIFYEFEQIFTGKLFEKLKPQRFTSC